MKRAKKHSYRIKALCEAFNIKLPEWAAINDEDKSYVSELRNQLIHEAIYANQPIGYNHSEINVAFGLQLLNEIIILNLIGLNSNYAEYPSEIWTMKFSLDLKKE